MSEEIENTSLSLQRDFISYKDCYGCWFADVGLLKYWVFSEKLKAVQEVIKKSDTKPIGH